MSQMGVFLLILLGCAAFFAFSAAFGGDASGADVDTNLDASADQETGVATSNFLTLRNLFLFGVGFGAVGAIATYLGQGPLAASMWGSGAGILMAAAAIWFYRIVRGQESNSVANLESLIGKRAHVITRIPETGYGEVSALDSLGTTVNLAARSQGCAIPAGSSVEIVAVAGNMASVKLA